MKFKKKKVSATPVRYCKTNSMHPEYKHETKNGTLNDTIKRAKQNTGVKPKINYKQMFG